MSLSDLSSAQCSVLCNLTLLTNQKHRAYHAQREVFESMQKHSFGSNIVGTNDTQKSEFRLIVSYLVPKYVEKNDRGEIRLSSSVNSWVKDYASSHDFDLHFEEVKEEEKEEQSKEGHVFKQGPMNQNLGWTDIVAFTIAKIQVDACSSDPVSARMIIERAPTFAREYCLRKVRLNSDAQSSVRSSLEPHRDHSLITISLYAPKWSERTYVLSPSGIVRAREILASVGETLCLNFGQKDDEDDSIGDIEKQNAGVQSLSKVPLISRSTSSVSSQLIQSSLIASQSIARSIAHEKDQDQEMQEHVEQEEEEEDDILIDSNHEDKTTDSTDESSSWSEQTIYVGQKRKKMDDLIVIQRSCSSKERRVSLGHMFDLAESISSFTPVSTFLQQAADQFKQKYIEEILESPQYKSDYVKHMQRISCSPAYHSMVSSTILSSLLSPRRCNF